MSSGRSFIGSLTYGAGLVCVFLGERVMAVGTARGVCTGLGLLLVLAAVGMRLARLRAARGEARRAEGLLLWLYALGLLALALYFAQSDLMDKLLSRPLAQGSPKLAGSLAALWPAVMAASLLPVLLVELAYASMAMAPVVEFGRVREALYSGLGLAGALVFAFSVGYVSDARDAKWDLSWFRTAKPGEATRRFVQGLDEPVQVSLFFPPANEVHDEVAEYFGDLAKESSRLKIASYDQAVDLAKARELGVSGNGAVVLSRGSRREQMVVGTNLEQARTQLRSLDQEIQKRLFSVAKARRTVYFTVGHGERSEDRTTATDQRGTISTFKELLRRQNYELRNLSAADGLASEVPRDAAAVLVVGPTSAFLPEELAALNHYLDGGGRVLLALDPDSSPDLKPLLEPLGLDLVRVTLANDRAFARRSHTAADRAIILTASYSSHPSVTSLAQLGSRAPLALLGAAPLQPTKNRPVGVSVDFTVHAHPETWNDLNGNFEFDAPAEARKAWELVAAVTRRLASGQKAEEAGRAIVVGDSDLLIDGIIDNPGNAYFALDTAKWLLGEEAYSGPTNSEADIPIEHTRKQDVGWFYSTVFLVPAVVLGVGFAVTRRSGRGRSAKGTATTTKERP